MNTFLQPSLPLAQGSGTATNPWFNVANQFTPRNLHDIIRWARYITIQSPTTTEVIRKLATYPITDFIPDTVDDTLAAQIKSMFEVLKMKELLQNVGFEFFTIGNVFLSIYFPIHRSLVCPSCNTSHSAKKASWTTFKAYNFHGTCPNCGYKGVFKRQDSKSLNLDDINLIKWTPEHIVVNHNPITGESEYYYKIPNSVKQKILKGDKLFINSIPWAMIEAVRYNQDFKFDNGSIFHLRNISSGGTVEGVSVPPMLSLFTLVYYQAVLRKANEAIASEYLNPMRIVSPQPSTANSDPAIAMSLKNFRGQMEEAIKTHKRDKNYFLISPVPVGYQAVGGEGRNLLVSQEIQQAEEQILLSLGVSRELLSGQTNWESSSVGLRMMENTLFSYVSRLEDLVDWINRRVSTYLNRQYAKTTLAPFKLLDDNNYKQLLVSLVQTGKVSFTTLFEELGIEFSKEQKRLVDEQAAAAATAVEVQFQVEQSQFMAAKKASREIKNDEEFTNALEKANAMAEQLYQADESTRRSALHELKVSDYAQYLMVSKLIQDHRNSEEHRMMAQQEKQQIDENMNGNAGTSGPGQESSSAPVNPAPTGQGMTE